MLNLQSVVNIFDQIVKKLPVILLCVGLSAHLNAQISNGGTPKSFTQFEVDEALVDEFVFDKPSIEALLEEDIERDSHGYNLRDAVAVPVNLNLNNSGIWFDLDNGDRIWRLQIRVPEALSLEAYYNQFIIPAGAELFIYNVDGSEIYGAFTHRNNKPSGRMSTEMIQGDVINFEYYEPFNQFGSGVLSIADLAYRYRDVLGMNSNGAGGAQSCQVDVGCSEADLWQDQLNSVVRVRTRINGQFFWCTGTLMNNTLEDCKPLILTALRCAIDGDDSSSQFEFDHYRFYFGYQASSCGSLSVAEVNSLTGCYKLADSNDESGAFGSDFLLLEMSTQIPSNYETFFAGWNATISPSPGGVSIHHPSGDVKKISTYLGTTVSVSWGLPDTHWSVNWAGTSNGHGVMEAGSTGAALFNGSGQVIGTLSGGASACNEVEPGGQNQPDSFGKLSYHWSENPNPMDEKLRELLDPSGQSALVFNGSSNPCMANSITEVTASIFDFAPNPVSERLILSLSDNQDNYRVDFIDITGRSILSLESHGYYPQLEIDVSSILSGVYLVRVTIDSGQSSTKRLIVDR